MSIGERVGEARRYGRGMWDRGVGGAVLEWVFGREMGWGREWGTGKEEERSPPQHSTRVIGLAHRCRMKATMLCNASWRFKNFNIDHREIEECRNAHIELQSRILELEQPQVVEQVNSLLGSL